MRPRISVTGTRAGMTHHQKMFSIKFLESLLKPQVAHGCCTGADEDFHMLTRAVHGADAYIVGLPSTHSSRILFHDLDFEAEPLPPLVRNKTIVQVGKDLLVGFPRLMHEEQRSGTWHALRYARKIKVPTLIVWPNGIPTLDGVSQYWKM